MLHGEEHINYIDLGVLEQSIEGGLDGDFVARLFGMGSKVLGLGRSSVKGSNHFRIYGGQGRQMCVLGKNLR